MPVTDMRVHKKKRKNSFFGPIFRGSHIITIDFISMGREKHNLSCKVSYEIIS